MQARILIIEDDADINDIIKARLSKDGHECTQAWSGSEAALRLESTAFDLVITDLMMPGLSGEGIVGLVRARSASTPIIVVSARVTPADKISLLKMGADDYLTKPFDLDELAMRVEVQLRRRQGLGSPDGSGGISSPAGVSGGTSAGRSAGAAGAGAAGAAAGTAGAAAASPSHLITFGRWTIDRDARTLHVGSDLINLTRIEFNIVELLASHPRKVFTKRELFELAWGEPYSVEDNTVNVHVSRIRSKLKESGTDSYICTVWGLGFKLSDTSQQ